ncbi:MAG: hypothetical protein C4527_14035 [Candidatus Omnitrophota bacterium]|jgi:hypothetical protein|nr:MAG: hypothetical protein C4527_14035 [Candidatus Omnitrophota bacterium]
MNTPCNVLKDKLLRYVETRSGKTDGVTESERRAIEAHLVHCQDCRNEVEHITSHLRALAGIPQPPIPASLASRCLLPAKNKKYGWRSGILKWGSAGSVVGLALICVFYSGVRFGKTTNEPTIEEDKFATLILVQNELMDRLEKLYVQRTATEMQPAHYPFAELKYTSHMIEACYQQTQSDYVARRGLQAAILRNILLLQSLCNHFEKHSNPTISEFEFTKTEDNPIKL